MSEKGAKGRQISVPPADERIVPEDEEDEQTTELVQDEEDVANVVGNGPDESRLTRDSLVEDLLSDDDLTMT